MSLLSSVEPLLREWISIVNLNQLWYFEVSDGSVVGVRMITAMTAISTLNGVSV